MRREVIRVIAPFINDFGQVISPGDHVIACTYCTKRVHTRKTEYIGYVERHGRKYAQVRTLDDRYISTLYHNRLFSFGFLDPVYRDWK